MIQKYIKDLLHEYSCVVLPNLGGFITRYISADIHPVTLKITPPAKEIAFNELLGTDDGMLVSYIARDMHISVEAAAELVEEFVDKTKNNLQRFNIFLIEGIGKLFYNDANKIEFLPELESNFLEDSYGLGELFLKVVEPNYNSMDKIPPKSSRPPLRRRPIVKREEARTEHLKKSKTENGDQETRIMRPAMLWSLMVIVLISSLTLLYMNKDSKSLASILPSLSKRNTISNSSNVIAANENDAALLDNASVEKSVATTAARSIKYYVIIGSFSAATNANKLVDATTSSDAFPTVINPEINEYKYRVSIAEFSDKTEARESLEVYKSKYGKSVWVLSK